MDWRNILAVYCYSHCLLDFVCVLSLFYYAVVGVYSGVVGCFALDIFLLSRGCWFSVFLLRGAYGYSIVYDCGISWSYPFFHSILYN